jgi:ribosomal protein L32
VIYLLFLIAMGLPSKRRTPRSKRERASHFALKPKAIAFDENGNPHLPHRAAPKTRTYRGRTAST